MLIGLNGQIGAGKDTVYQRIAEVVQLDGLHVDPERVAFADSLKDAVNRLFVLPAGFLEHAKRDNRCEVEITTPRFRLSRIKGVGWTARLPFMSRVTSRQTVRSVLQRFGAEVVRDLFGADFWVDLCLPKSLDHSGRLIVVTDCRYPNEVQRVKDLGGVVVRVLNGPPKDQTHSSEQIIPDDGIDFFMDNSSRDDGFVSLDANVRTLLRACRVVSRERTNKKIKELPQRRVDGVITGITDLSTTNRNGGAYRG